MTHYLLNGALQFFQKSILTFDFRNLLFAISIIFLLTFQQFAQDTNIQFSHLTVEDGLSVNGVTQIIQDNQGFIWIGTYNGLNKYDGYSFKIFLPEKSNPYSISDANIKAICQGNDGYIWVGTGNGLNRFDPNSGKFYRYKNDPQNPKSLSNNFVYTIFKDDSGNIWIGTVNGLNKYNKTNDDFTVFKKVSQKLNPDSLNSVTGISEDPDGDLWLGTWNGLTKLNPSGNVVKQYFEQPIDSREFNYRQTSVLFRDKANNLWIGTNGDGIKKLNLQTGKITEYFSSSENRNSISNGYITAIMQDKSNNIWIGTLNGLNRYNTATGNFLRIFNNPQISSSLIGNGIFSLTEDSSSLIWVGTTTGISKFYQPNCVFHYLQSNKEHPSTSLISSSVISAFIDHKENIWAATMEGLDEIQKGKSKVIHFRHIPGNANSISNNFVRSVFVDSRGMVWIGTNNDGLNLYNPASGKFKLYTYDRNNPYSISNNGITSICEDNNGNIWLGTWWGLNKFDIKTGRFTRFFSSKSNPNAIKSDMIWDVFKDSKGMIWVGTEGGGASQLNPLNNKIINFNNDSTNINYISNNRVYTVFESKDGLIWLGTTNGLNCYNRITGKITTYTVKNGLPDNLVNGIQEDNSGCIWVATDKGLSKFSRNENRFINYGKRNGLTSLEFTSNIALKSKSGILYFGLDGLMYFNPEKIKEEYLTAPVVFTDLKIFNKSVPISSNGILNKCITNKKTIYIPHGNDVITLDFALLDYFDVKKNMFSYKLDGFDIGWNNVGTRNSATYTNLPPGNYTFHVKATNNNGIKNEREASLNIIIVPEFYQTWWFKVTFGAGLLLIIILIFQFRTRGIQKRNKILENKVMERTRDLNKTIKDLNHEIASKDKFFSIIAHDLRSPFVALLGFSKLLVDEINILSKDDLNIIAGNILKSARQTFGLLENLLNWARIKTGRIVFEPEKINVKEILNEMIELYKGNASGKNISININTNGTPAVFADLNMLQTILRNLISNAIKFTPPNGKIDISSEENHNSVRIKVADTGIGISPDRMEKLFQIDQNISTIGTQKEEGSGLGLILCKEFIELNKGEISVKSQVGKGSEFSFTLPKYNDSEPII